MATTDVTSFLNACNSGDISYVKRFNCNVVDVFCKGFNLACMYGHTDIALCLLQRIPISSYNKGLCYACKYGHVHVVKKLIEKLIETLGISLDLARGLEAACNFNKIAVVKYLVEKANVSPKYGLDRACMNGYYNIIVYLVNAGVCDINRGMWCICHTYLCGYKYYDHRDNGFKIILLLSNKGGLLPADLSEHIIRDLLNYGLFTCIKSIDGSAEAVAQRCARIRESAIIETNIIIDSVFLHAGLKLWDKNVASIISEYYVTY
jgi:hypothetical protein